ncbi:hypothetical protein J7E79_14505 [Bacillus sp. ISL-40]|uniref:hypothetical protein n=1 Tax=unclassified Bacillus (in: firmicutes) TaxID=185979 RepID=UPI001BEAAC62|nr:MULTISPECIES: hypothetical protein [unclassified Bacillus (in: firmicutes)]MBT2698621.1 hypothetical protein [Bacillus sp. ISL-40]MBT2720254.1 hypothetical protein [Bacillus sp. ISL-46]MBT2739152.1 hypothetical protein [Bacillus sp. ISL-77]
MEKKKPDMLRHIWLFVALLARILLDWHLLADMRLLKAKKFRVRLAQLLDIVDQNSDMRNDIIAQQFCHLYHPFD